MSLSKQHKRVNSKAALEKCKTQEANNYIYEHVRRIDGQETIRKYVKGALLGKGGFANCFVSQNTQTHKKSATKIITKDLLTSQRTRLRVINHIIQLFNEIRLHKTLHHQNVVEFHHFFQDKDNVYIFLELCENQSLNQLIRIRGTFITPEIQSFMYGILNGVQYIHSKQIIHRDLKLGNIFIDDKLNVKIGDFGLATKLEFRKENKRTVCGTPNYIAPEILEGKGYHFQVDIWSIGVILYTLYFGCPPFETQEANTTYLKIKDCNYVIPKLNTVPIEAVNLIQKILVRNPADRPTIQNILDGQFMRLGQGIILELPQICVKKAPSKRQLSLNNTIVQHKRKLNSKSRTRRPSAMAETDFATIPYVIEVDQVQQNKFYLKMSNGFSAVFEKDVEIVFKNQYGMWRRIPFSNFIEERVFQSPLKYILLALQNKFNSVCANLKCEKLLDQTLFPTTKPVFIKKLRILDHVAIYMLSNGSTQFHYQKVDYLITKNQQIAQIDPKRNRIRRIDLQMEVKSKSASPCSKSQLFQVELFLAQIKTIKLKCLTQKSGDSGQLDQNSI